METVKSLDESLSQLVTIKESLKAEVSSLMLAPNCLVEDRDKFKFYDQHTELLRLISENLESLTRNLDKAISKLD